MDETDGGDFGDFFGGDYLDPGDDPVYDDGPVDPTDDWNTTDPGDEPDPTDDDPDNPSSSSSGGSSAPSSTRNSSKPPSNPFAKPTPKPAGNPQGNLQPTAKPRSTNSGYFNIGDRRNYPGVADRLGVPVYRNIDRGQAYPTVRGAPYAGSQQNPGTMAAVATENAPMVFAGAFVLLILLVATK